MHGPLSSIPASDKLFVARVHPRCVNLLSPPPPPSFPPIPLSYAFFSFSPLRDSVTSRVRAESNARKMNIRAANAKKGKGVKERGGGGGDERESDARSTRIKRRKKRDVETRVETNSAERWRRKKKKRETRAALVSHSAAR